MDASTATPTYNVQLSFEDFDQLTLSCPSCHQLIAMPRDWCELHQGESVGCPGCSLPARIPTP